MSDAIYLDSAATTALDPRVLEAMLPYLGERFGNPSSVHGKGREAKVALELAREHVAALIGGHPAEIIFTSGGTEADNFALRIALEDVQGRHIVTSSVEHEAILKPLQWYHDHGYEVTFLPPGPDGTVAFADVERAVREDTVLISLMHANNETGSLHPIDEIAGLANERGILFHTDAVQSAGKIPVDARTIPFAFASLSAHKIHGPKGIGALYARTGREISPFIRGGAQERGRRGGTENTAAAVGFGEAARLALSERDERMQRWRDLGALFRDEALARFPHALINTAEDAVPTIMSVSFPYTVYGMDGEALLLNMDLDGVAVSSGSACTAGSIEPSHVMLAIGHDLETAKSTLRFSFGKDTTRDELMTSFDTLQAIVQRIRTV
jgi:cysteine desulfurase